MKHFILLFFTFINIIPQFAHQPERIFFNNSVFKTANISVSIRDLKSDKVIYQNRPQNLTVPASTMKVITTASALEVLKPDFRFETDLLLDGKIESGVLKGNLIIKGSGDPTLGSSKMGDVDFLIQWVDAIRKAGIKQIEGEIIADESCFDNEGVNPKWTWEDIGNYFAPGIYGIGYRDNTLAVTFKSGDNGTTPEIIDMNPKVPGIYIENNLKSAAISIDSAWFYGSPKSLNRSVRGSIPMNNSAFTVKADLPDPASILINDLTEKLKNAGVSIKNQEILSNNLFKPLIYKHYSPKLSEIIREINQRSNNFYAEQLFKYLSINSEIPANNNASVNLIRQHWKNKGLDIRQLNQVDGCGLSSLNSVSAEFLTALMVYMYKKSNYRNEFIKSLSVSGKSGTLSGMFLNTPLEGKVFGKSGTITKVRCYTGYIITDKKEIAFTVMVNHFQGKSKDTAKIIEDFLLTISKT